MAVLDELAQVGPDRVADALAELRQWAGERGLVASPGEYLGARATGGRCASPQTRTSTRRSVPPGLSAQRAGRKRDVRAPDLLVIAASRPWTCDECGVQFGASEFLMIDDAGPHCMDCLDLAQLDFLSAGNTALTRRAKQASRLCAVLVRWSRSRKRYERQGILAEPEAIEQAEQQCLADAEIRQRRRIRSEQRRDIADTAFIVELTAAIRLQFPGCPGRRAEEIARHAAVRGSGRAGRSHAGPELDPDAVRLAVAAAVRHDHTSYEDLLMAGVSRVEARRRVLDDVDRVLADWSP